MVVERSIKDVKVFPELHIITSNATSLADGKDTLFRLKSINSKNQVVLPRLMSFEQQSQVGAIPNVDSKILDTIHTNQLPGIGTDWDIFGKSHPFFMATKFLDIDTANNSGSAVSDYRARMTYFIDAFDTTKKIANGLPLSVRDKEAIDLVNIPRQKRGLEPINAQKAIDIGIGLPQGFEDFLKLHEVIGSEYGVLPDSTTLSTTRTEIFNENVTNPGLEAYVLESIYIERPSQSELGEVTISISRDEDDDLIQFDPANLRGDNVQTNLHIHAFEKLKVEVEQTSGASHANFKASALVTKRKVGLGFKAKLAEFLGINNLPTALDITRAELDVIDNQNLRELARLGIIAIG